MSIEKIERDLHQAIDDFRKYPASDDRCRGALLEFRATCSTENIRALLDELSRLREALKPFADEAKVWSGYDETENLVESWAEGPDSQLRVCHLRAAARVLSEREGQE
jgi:HEPN domain-containing protein